jgi:soluble lytic murein transglycosylase-like protein
MFMIAWCTALLLCCALLLGGCGRGKMARKPTPAPPIDVAQEDVKDVPQESLSEQLSSNRLDELYAKSGMQGQDPALEAELKKWDQTLKTDVPVARNKEVKAYLVYFSTERKQVIQNYLARSTRYLPLIREIFQEHGLPEDLAYLAMIESGFNPYAYSPAHAAGMWQFISGTARRYGLEINNYVDERRDPVKSTHAAAKYLLDLYKQFGSWYLAAASYNCGENRVQREIDSSNHKNFWELSANQCLPNETKNYVPQMIAATIIAKNPEKFGFTRVPYLPPLRFDTVKVNEPTSVRAISIACNVPPEEISLLNPELRKGTTPPETFALKIPKNSKDLFNRNIQVARIEVPSGASAPIETASNSYWPGYPRRESYSQRESTSETYVKREAPSSSRYSEKTASRTAKSYNHSRYHSQYRTAQAHKGKSESGKVKSSSVQVASMFPTGSSSRSSKGSSSAQKGKTCKSTSESGAKKSSSKRTKKKSSGQTSSLSGKSKTAQSPAKGGSCSRLAREAKKPEGHKKKQNVQTAKLRASNS